MGQNCKSYKDKTRYRGIRSPLHLNSGLTTMLISQIGAKINILYEANKTFSHTPKSIVREGKAFYKNNMPQFLLWIKYKQYGDNASRLSILWTVSPFSNLHSIFSTDDKFSSSRHDSGK